MFLVSPIIETNIINFKKDNNMTHVQFIIVSYNLN